MTLPPKPEYPSSPEALAAFIAYRGPQVEQRRVSFEEINAELVAIYALWPKREAEHLLDDLCNRITDPLLRTMARRTRGPMLGTGLITQQTVFYCLINARTWLNLAILHDAVSPKT